MYICDNISLNSSIYEKYLRKMCRENHNTRFMLKFFFRELCCTWKKYGTARQAIKETMLVRRKDEFCVHENYNNCTHTYTHTHAPHTHKHTHTHARTHHTNTHHTHARTHHTHTTHSHKHTNTHTQTHTHAPHRHTNTHKHTHTHAPHTHTLWI